MNQKRRMTILAVTMLAALLTGPAGLFPAPVRTIDTGFVFHEAG